MYGFARLLIRRLDSINKVKETFMEEKRSFTDGGASTSRTQSLRKPEQIGTTQEAGPSLST